MKEKENQTKKFQWKNIHKKKWFFPAIYLIAASLLITVVVWYQTLDDPVPEVADHEGEGNNYIIEENDSLESAVPVSDTQEVIKVPVPEEVETSIVTKFYEYDAEDEEQENAIIYHNNSYYQSKGVDIASNDGEAFEVLAALSGTVTNTKEDPLLGKVVVLSHDNNVDTYYASLDELQVKTGEKVSQGDVLGTAGKSLLRKDHGVHVHFELRKNDEAMNPEVYFNQPLDQLTEYAAIEEDDSNDEEDAQEEPEDENNNNRGNDENE